jgi:hypothetical protein
MAFLLAGSLSCRMTLTWTIDAENCLMAAVAKGDVTRAEVETYLDAIIQNRVLSYRKVFDAGQGNTSMTADDVLPLAVRMRSFHTLGKMGPLAIVVPPGRGKRLTRAFGMLAVADRPMRVFEEAAKAYRWIIQQDCPV